MDPSAKEREALRRRADARLDEALDESFPASDPVAIYIETDTERAGSFSVVGEGAPLPATEKSHGDV